jgi:hypothetical protein
MATNGAINGKRWTLRKLRVDSAARDAGFSAHTADGAVSYSFCALVGSRAAHAIESHTVRKAAVFMIDCYTSSTSCESASNAGDPKGCTTEHGKACSIARSNWRKPSIPF